MDKLKMRGNLLEKLIDALSEMPDPEYGEEKSEGMEEMVEGMPEMKGKPKMAKVEVLSIEKMPKGEEMEEGEEEEMELGEMAGKMLPSIMKKKMQQKES